MLGSTPGIYLRDLPSGFASKTTSQYNKVLFFSPFFSLSANWRWSVSFADTERYRQYSQDQAWSGAQNIQHHPKALMIQSIVSIFYSDRILILFAFMVSIACNDVDFRLDTG